MYPNKKVQDLIGTTVQVEMKGEKYILEGTLSGMDDYLNLYMVNTAEVIDGEKSRIFGSIVLRGNNIVLITPVR